VVRFALHFSLKRLRRISTAEMKEMGPGKLIPKLFQQDRGVIFFLLPQDRDHFAENHHALMLYIGGRLRLADYASKLSQKSLPVRTAWIR
jgi:hypothetical protein